MESDIINYLLHIAPSLAVVIALLGVVQKRLNDLEDRIMHMLEECWQEVLKDKA